MDNINPIISLGTMINEPDIKEAIENLYTIEIIEEFLCPTREIVIEKQQATYL